MVALATGYVTQARFISLLVNFELQGPGPHTKQDARAHILPGQLELAVRLARWQERHAWVFTTSSMKAVNNMSKTLSLHLTLTLKAEESLAPHDAACI